MKKCLLLLFFLAGTLSVQSIYAQQRTVSGKVTSADDGAPVPGVNVLLKGTATGTVTDLDGNYKIAVPSEATVLVFSFIGLQTQEVTVGAQAVINVIMETEAEILEAVVVTALGIERDKRALSYATQEVQGEDLAQKSTNSVFQSLQGKVAGLNISSPGGAAGQTETIILRGVTSIAGNSRNQPLIVVDGTPINIDIIGTDVAAGSAQVFGSGNIGSGLADLNPQDIESVNVLKGPTAAALYGIRAANGAIIITTKKPSSQKGLSVRLTTSVNVTQVNILPSYQNEFGQGNDFRFGTPNGLSSFGRRFGSIPNDSIQNFNGENIAFQNFPDNVRDFFNTGVLINNDLQISGGNGESGFILSVGSSLQDGIVPFSDLQRTNVRLGGNTKVLDRLSLNGSISFSRREVLGSPQGNNGSSPFFLLQSLPRSLDLVGNPVLNPDGSQNFFSGFDNPLFSAEFNTVTQNVDRVIGNYGLQLDITEVPGLKLNYNFGVDISSDNRQQVFAVGSARFGDGTIIQDNQTFRSFESTFIVSYDRNINEDFSIGIKAGHNLNSAVRERFIVQANDLLLPGLNNVNNSATINPDARNGIDFQRRLIGVFGEVSVGYRDWAYLTFTGRNDWSSTLPEGNRGFFYQSIGGSLIFTEAFNIESSILSFGKVKASFAEVGNDAPAFLTSNVFVANPSFGNNVSQVNFPFNGNGAFTAGGTIGNNALVPEENQEIEVGIELGLLNNRINIDANYYTQDVTNQILAVQVPSSTGFTSLTSNVGLITNEGIEVVASADILQRNNFNWKAIVNFSRIRNEVVELSDGLEFTQLGGFTTNGPAAQVGEAIGVFRGTMVQRDPITGMPLILATGTNRGTLLNPGATGVIGDPNPDFNLSWINQLSWKGINFSFQWDLQKGGDIFSNTIIFSNFLGVTEESAVNREGSRIIPGVLANADGSVILDGDGNPVPNNIQITTEDFFQDLAFGANETAVFDGSFLRLREITLGYSIPKALLDKTPFGGIDISFSARNVFTFAPNINTNIDPEVSNSAGALFRGFEVNSGPGVVNYGFNASFRF